MPARSADGILRTEPVNGYSEPARGHPLPAAVSEDDAAVEAVNAQRNLDWENWFRRRLNYELAEGKAGGQLIWAIHRIIDDKTMDRLDGTGERLAKLELQLAEMRGALGVKADAAHETGAAMGAIRDELEDTIAVQAQRISELELRCATLSGALDVLRGKGVPGAFNIKGTFDADASYSYLDVVCLGGSSFAARRDRPGPCPGDGWQLLSGVGKRGARGERGLVGPRGADAPTWVGLSFDTKTQSFTTRMSDGSLGPSISLHVMFADIGVDPEDYSLRFVGNDGSALKINLRPLFERFVQEMANAAR